MGTELRTIDIFDTIVKYIFNNEEPDKVKEYFSTKPQDLLRSCLSNHSSPFHVAISGENLAMTEFIYKESEKYIEGLNAGECREQILKIKQSKPTDSQKKDSPKFITRKNTVDDILKLYNEDEKTFIGYYEKNRDELDILDESQLRKLALEALVLNRPTSLLFTPLLMAAELKKNLYSKKEKRMAIVKFLLDKNAHIFATNSYGQYF